MKKNRRENIITRMIQLSSAGQDCKNCPGTCCTFESNSMMTSPLETTELLIFLQSQGMKNEGLKEKINQTIKQYRLDQLTGYGRKSFLRRTYTCPFFNHSELGCPLPVEVKPYGCLAFNSHHPTSKASEHCYSEKELLITREDENIDYENAINNSLKEKYSLWWDKLPMPVALMEMWDQDIKEEDLYLTKEAK